MVGPLGFKIEVYYERCNECGLCAYYCPKGVLIMGDKGPIITANSCMGCLTCVHVCPMNAISISKA